MISVLITTRNRNDLFQRTLESFHEQKYAGEWEMVVVDDVVDGDCKKFLKGWRLKVPIRYIAIDRKKSGIPAFSNSPSLGINVGLKRVKYPIVYKTDPENIQLTKTLETAVKIYDEKKLIFGMAIRGNKLSHQLIEAGKLDWHTEGFPKREHHVERIPCSQAKGGGPFYYAAVFSRDRALKINGVEEEYLRGHAAEDDDFALRMKRSGAAWVWDDRIKIFHQYHTIRGYLSPAQEAAGLHINRKRYHGIAAPDTKLIVANKDYDWGSDDVVIEDMVL